MLEAISGVVTVGVLVMNAVVGLRLLWLARQEDTGGAVRMLGLYFLLHGTLATGLSIATYLGWSSAELALPDALARAINGGFFVTSTLGLVCLLHFTRKTFRPASPTARSFAIGTATLMAVSVTALAAGEGFEVRVLNGPAYWVHFAARVSCWVWVACESLGYWHRQQRRLALGLADPIVANRFLLWGLWGVGMAVLSLSDPIARIWYVSLAGTATQWLPELGRPIIELTVPVACALNLGSLVLMGLTFFPIPAYRRWVEARHAARVAA